MAGTTILPSACNSPIRRFPPPRFSLSAIAFGRACWHSWPDGSAARCGRGRKMERGIAGKPLSRKRDVIAFLIPHSEFPTPNSAFTMSRLSTGISALDELLGGGLLPGRLTVVVVRHRHWQNAIGIAICRSRTAAGRARWNYLRHDGSRRFAKPCRVRGRMYDWALSEPSPSGDRPAFNSVVPRDLSGFGVGDAGSLRFVTAQLVPPRLLLGEVPGRASGGNCDAPWRRRRLVR